MSHIFLNILFPLIFSLGFPSVLNENYLCIGDLSFIVHMYIFMIHGICMYMICIHMILYVSNSRNYSEHALKCVPSRLKKQYFNGETNKNSRDLFI